MIRLEIKDQDGNMWGFKECMNQSEVDSYLATMAISGVPWINNNSFSINQIDIGNAPLMANLRIERNKLLAASDWTQLPDCPLTYDQKVEWATYRHALRQLPDQQNFDPNNFSWPTEPA